MRLAGLDRVAAILLHSMSMEEVGTEHFCRMVDEISHVAGLFGGDPLRGVADPCRRDRIAWQAPQQPEGEVRAQEGGAEPPSVGVMYM